MRIFRNLLVGLVLTMSVPASFATSFTAVEAAANAENWALAEAEAARLDAAEKAGDFYAAFVAARRLASQGRCQEAAILFDTLTLTRPYFTPGYEGAFLCLMALGQKEMAIARLDTMLAVLPDGPQRDVVFQVRQNLDAADRPVFNIFGSFAPSSNANRQTEETRIGPFYIADGARAKVGALANIGASVTIRMIASDHFTMTGVARGELSYNTARDVLEPRLTLETPMTFGSLDNTTFLATPFVTAALSNGEHSHTKAGARGIVAVQLSPVISATLAGSAAYAAFPLQPFRDGWQYELSLGSSWVVNPQTMLSASLRAAFDAADDVSRQSTELSARLRVDHAMESGVILGAELTVGTRLHNAPPPMSTGANQQDQFASVRLEASHRDIVIGPFMPQIYYEYATQESDNAFYRYDSHDIGLAMRARL